MRKQELLNHLSDAHHRIKELENILCPGEQHAYAVVPEESIECIDPWGSVIMRKKYVCKRCFKVFIHSEGG